MNLICDERTITTWRELIDFDYEIAPENSSEKDWICRGENANRPFTTSLERACGDFGLDMKTAQDKHTEDKLIREFRRRFHFYETHVPDSEDTLEWLAIMRHFGAPTRLLDWTYSFFVALFFVLENKRSKKNTGELCQDKNGNEVKDGYVVWCIHNGWLHKHVWEKLRTINIDNSLYIDQFAQTRNPQAFKKLFIESNENFVNSVNPFRYNQRLTAQQGLFLCPGNISVPFEENLKVLNEFPEAKEHIIKLVIDDSVRVTALLNLNRMNISRATLFPGLEGFAQSLWTQLPRLSEIDLKLS